MLHSHLAILRCPYTGKPLRLTVFKERGKEIVEGVLATDERQWPIIDGIPRLLPDELMDELVIEQHPEFFAKHKVKAVSKRKTDAATKAKKRTASSFGFEWLAYPDVIKSFEMDFHRYFDSFFKDADFKDKVVLDAGCGMAKHGYFISKRAKLYIGMDLSNAVEAAYKNTKKNGSLVVQADIYHVPLDPKQIDLIYSIGVLHHLPNPKKGFLSLASMLSNGKEMFIWVYGKENNLRAQYIYDPIRVITTRLPKTFLYYLCYIPAAITEVLNWGTKFFNAVGLPGVGKAIPFSYYANFPFLFKVSDSFDIFATPLQVYYVEKDIRQWYKDGKFRTVKFVPDTFQGIKAYGKK